MSSSPIRLPLTPPNLEEFVASLPEEVFTTRSSALTEVVLSMLTSTSRCRCAAHLSLSSTLAWSTLERALGDGVVDEVALTRHLLGVADGFSRERVYALDLTNDPHPRATTAPERELLHASGGHRRTHRAEVGWRWSWLVRVSPEPTSWVAPVMVERLGHEVDPVVLATEMVRRVCALDGANQDEPSVFLCDAGYPAGRLEHALRTLGVPAVLVVRLTLTQVFHARGEGRVVHGEKLRLVGPTEVVPALEAGWEDPTFGGVRLRSWEQVHQHLTASDLGLPPRTPVVVEGCVTVLDVDHLRAGLRRSTIALWCSRWVLPWLRPTTVLTWYLRRFSVEHFFRTIKTTMGWREHRTSDPAQATRWSQCVMTAYACLVLARDRVHSRLPWEDARRTMTPHRVLRDVGLLVQSLARAPGAVSRGGGPGRAAGERGTRHTRHPRAKKVPRKALPRRWEV